ncbi:MAG TPA: DUF2911 domain-containing protein [Pyrinomonadaceae bacterium]|jgi:hypothetical protein
MKVLRKNLFPRTVALLLLVAAAAAVNAYAQQTVRVPRPSQKASVTQTIGVTDVTITYSRPGVKGRRIWGDAVAAQAAGSTATLDDARSRPKDAPIVPFDHVWRTGANEATLFTVTDDVMINGQKLPAGKYSLHTIPGKTEWTIIFNRDDGQWGSFQYDEKKDALRVKARPSEAPMQEWLRFEIDPVSPDSAQVSLRWERIIVPFTVTVPDVNALTLQKARASVAAAAADDWRTPLQAANFVFVNNITASMPEAMNWLEQSIKVKETFGNMYTKARVLGDTGKTAEAIVAGERALQLGKEAKADTSDLEKRLATWRAKKM